MNVSVESVPSGSQSSRSCATSVSCRSPHGQSNSTRNTAGLCAPRRRRITRNALTGYMDALVAARGSWSDVPIQELDRTWSHLARPCIVIPRRYLSEPDRCAVATVAERAACIGSLKLDGRRCRWRAREPAPHIHARARASLSLVPLALLAVGSPAGAARSGADAGDVGPIRGSRRCDSVDPWQPHAAAAATVDPLLAPRPWIDTGQLPRRPTSDAEYRRGARREPHADVVADARDRWRGGADAARSSGPAASCTSERAVDDSRRRGARSELVGPVRRRRIVHVCRR